MYKQVFCIAAYVALPWSPATMAAAAPAKPLNAEDAVQLIGESDDQAAALQALDTYVKAADPVLVPFLQHLRHTMLEHPSPRFRERARRGLIALLLARQDGSAAVNPEVFAALVPTAGANTPPNPKVDPRLPTTYQLAGAGKAGADGALAAFTPPLADKDKDKAVRLVAANSLGLTGVTPTDAMVTRIDAAIDAETDREARAEELQTLAAFATAAPKAYQALAQRLLNTKDCALIQRTAMTLPAADLRLWIFKRLPGKEGSRGAAVRHWVKTKVYQNCGG